MSTEDAYAYGKFARTVLGTNDVDFRARPHSAEEADFLASHRRGHRPRRRAGPSPTPTSSGASSVLLVGLEPEDESPIVFLRLRKAFRKHRTAVYAVSPVATRGLAKMGGTLIPAAPGTEPEVLRALAEGSGTDVVAAAGQALRDNAVVLVGERLAMVPGALSAAAALAEATGARLAWVPRRAGERGAARGRRAADAAARWPPGIRRRGARRGRSAWGVPVAARGRRPRHGRHPRRRGVRRARGARRRRGRPARPRRRRRAAEAFARPFVVSLEIRPSAVTAVADVVLPVAAHAEKGGTFVDWEGRVRRFEAALETGHVSDYRALDMVADEMGEFLGTRTLREVRSEMESLGPWGRAPAAARPSRPVRSRASSRAPSSSRRGATCSTAGRSRTASRSSPAPRPTPVARVSRGDGRGPRRRRRRPAHRAGG